tara:strand:- start:71412 stop:72293 length:882 start_codon:yes stop_codon:yes gene_type:complete
MIKKYPDKSSYVIDQGSNHIVFRINTYEDLHHLKQLVDAHNNRTKSRLNVIIPNLLDAQADRRFEDNQSFGLKLVLQDLIRLNADISIFHPHNPEVVEMAFEIMGKKVKILDNLHFMMYVLSTIAKEYSDVLDDRYFTTKRQMFLDYRLQENLILMSADAGGFKPLMNLATQLNWNGVCLSSSKSRFKGELTQLLPQQDFGGKDILIVDDISVYGGTFKGLAKLLRKANCGKLYLAVSHITMQNLFKDEQDNPVTEFFDKVFTTDSKYPEYYIRDKQGQPLKPVNLEIIKAWL